MGKFFVFRHIKLKFRSWLYKKRWHTLWKFQLEITRNKKSYRQKAFDKLIWNSRSLINQLHSSYVTVMVLHVSLSNCITGGSDIGRSTVHLSSSDITVTVLGVSQSNCWTGGSVTKAVQNLKKGTQTLSTGIPPFITGTQQYRFGTAK